MTARGDEIAEAIRGTLISPNEADRNWEAANVVDGLFAIARGLHHVAAAIEQHGGGPAAQDPGPVEEPS